MKLMETSFFCKGCETTTKIEARLPSWTEPTRVKATCAECKTTYMVSLWREIGIGKHQLKMNYKVLEISDKCRAIVLARFEAQEKQKAEQAQSPQ